MKKKYNHSTQKCLLHVFDKNAKKTKNTHETAWVSSFCSTHKEWSISSVLAPYLLRPRTEFELVCPSFPDVALVGPSSGAGDTSRIFYSPGKSEKKNCR